MSDTITRLAALRARQAATVSDVASDRLEAFTGFGSNPGALNAKVYRPDDLPAGAPLVVVLHGCLQTAAAYDHHSGWSRLADQSRFALLYPEQSRANNPNLCFNWFAPADASRGSGEAQSIHQMIEAMVAAHGLDRRRIFITGLSAGGAMAAAMLATYPEMFAGGAVIAGLPYGSATTVPQAFDRMRGHGGPSEPAARQALRDASDHQGPWPRISIWHGTADRTVAPSNADAVASQWHDVHAIDGGPTYSKADGRLEKQVWCDEDGAAMIEINRITGMGHGTPLDVDLGTPGPYMLDVGISSTREIARFWDLPDGAATSPAARVHLVVHAGERPQSRSRPLEAESASPLPAAAERRRFPSQAPGAGRVKTIIEDALRAAGLMR